MTERSTSQYWIFSNKPRGAYAGTVWDMGTALERKQYTIKENEPNRRNVQPGDVVYMRIYGDAFIGRFFIDAPWEVLPPHEQNNTELAGVFPMRDIELWESSVPQSLVLSDLSNKDHRRRIARITHDDSVMIETARRVYRRLGFGDADSSFVILEKGLEEAIKPNLEQLGLKLAGKKIRQQFSMGIGVGRSDLICTDVNGDFVVLELKRGMTSDETIGQVLRYVGWMEENLAKEGQEVHGWIVASGYDEQLRLAAKASRIKLVQVKFG